MPGIQHPIPKVTTLPHNTHLVNILGQVGVSLDGMTIDSVEGATLPKAAIASQDSAKIEALYKMSVESLGEEHPGTKGLKSELDKAKMQSNNHAQIKNRKQLLDA
eukprot:10773194-Karenia_brevis.AAC.1